MKNGKLLEYNGDNAEEVMFFIYGYDTIKEAEKITSTNTIFIEGVFIYLWDYLFKDEYGTIYVFSGEQASVFVPSNY